VYVGMDPEEVSGVNTLADLKAVEVLMAAGR